MLLVNVDKGERVCEFSVAQWKRGGLMRYLVLSRSDALAL